MRTFDYSLVNGDCKAQLSFSVADKTDPGLQSGVKPSASGQSSWKQKAMCLCQRYWQRHHTRQQLAQLSEAQLKDVGLSLEQAQEEANLPFWK